jgi:stage II sporulation protein D
MNNSQPQVQVSENTPSGRVKKVKINNKELSGEKLRHILGLPSTWCRFKVNAQQVKIESRGYGHGLGLCQYGANGMALEGKNYHQILKHYYQDIEFSQLKY